jgi:hypothetical protein
MCQLCRKPRVLVALALGISVLDGDILSFDVAQIAESLPDNYGAARLATDVER